MKNKDIYAVFDFYENSNIDNKDKYEFMKLFVNLGAMSSFCEHRFVPTGKLRLKINALYIDKHLSQTFSWTELIQSENISTYSLSKIAISKIEEQKLNSNDFTISATVDTEFEVYGYAQDINKKYPWKEYRNINNNFPLYNRDDLEKIDKKYEKFMEYKKEYLKKESA